MTDKRIAAIRLRGMHDVNPDTRETLKSLRLLRCNYCVVLHDTPSTRGMLQRAKDRITWGSIDDATYALLVSKRGEPYSGRTEGYHERKFIEVQGKRIKPFFRLNPPTGGFERKGIKTPKSIGGALGARKDINELIRRMVG